MSDSSPDELAEAHERRGRSLDRAVSFSDAVAIFYLLVLFCISGLMLAEAWYVARHPWLRRPADGRSLRDQVLPSLGSTATFALAILLSLIDRSVGLFSLILLGLVQRFTTQRDLPARQPRPETRSLLRKNRLS